MTFVCFGIAKLECQMLNIIEYFFLSLICPCIICLKRKICKENKKQKDQNALYIIVSVYTRRYESYKMYLEGLHQTVMIMCELKWFSHISNRHNIYTLMQSCDIFHTQYAIFFATLDTCAGTMWFSHHKAYIC